MPGYVDKITIMQVLPALNHGGVERGAIDIANYLANEGHRAIVVSAGGSIASRLNKNVILVNYKDINSKNPFKMIRNFFFLNKMVDLYKPDIIHARSRAPAWSAYFSAKVNNISFLTSFHGFYGYKSSLKKNYNSVMTKGRKIIAVSKAIEEHLIKDYNISPQKIVTINRSVDIKTFSRESLNSERIAQLEKKISLPDKKFRLLLPSRLSRKKGHFYLLEALATLERNDFVCFMFDNHSSPSFKKEILGFIEKTPALHNKIYFLDPENDMPALYHLCDVIVCPAVYPEAFGRAVIEGCAMEKLVIATDLGGPKYTILNGKTGFLVKPDDKFQLAAVFSKALDMRLEEIKVITTAARDYVSKNFSLQDMCEKTLQVYKELYYEKSLSR